MQRHKVALLQELVKFHTLEITMNLGIRIMAKHPHAKARRPTGNRLANPAKADNAKRLAMNVMSPGDAPV